MENPRFRCRLTQPSDSSRSRKEYEGPIARDGCAPYKGPPLSRRRFLRLVPFLTLASQTTSLESSSAWHDQIPSNETSQEVRRLQGMDPVRALTFDDAIVLKDGNLLFITDADGMVPIKDEHDFGLYYQDCRVLNG